VEIILSFYSSGFYGFKIGFRESSISLLSNESDAAGS